MKWTLRPKIIMSLLACLLLGGYGLYNRTALQAKAEMSLTPADYGLPSEIGGYQIRVAQSWETRFCNPSMDLQLFLYAIPDQPQTLTTADIQQLEAIVSRRIHIAFSNETPDLKRQEETLNATATGECPQNSPIIPPTPDTNTIIAPATSVFATVQSEAPPQNSPIIPPTPDTNTIIAPPTNAG